MSTRSSRAKNEPKTGARAPVPMEAFNQGSDVESDSETRGGSAAGVAAAAGLESDKIEKIKADVLSSIKSTLTEALTPLITAVVESTVAGTVERILDERFAATVNTAKAELVAEAAIPVSKLKEEFEARFLAVEGVTAVAKETLDSNKTALDAASKALSEAQARLAELDKRREDLLDDIKERVQEKVFHEMDDKVAALEELLSGGGGASDSAGRKLAKLVVVDSEFNERLEDKISDLLIPTSKALGSSIEGVSDVAQAAIKEAEGVRADFEAVTKQMTALESRSENRVHTVEKTFEEIKESNDKHERRIAQLEAELKEQRDLAKAKDESFHAEVKRQLEELAARIAAERAAGGAGTVAKTAATTIPIVPYCPRFPELGDLSTVNPSDATDEEQAARKKHVFPESLVIPPEHVGGLTGPGLAKLAIFCNFFQNVVSHVATTPHKVISYNLPFRMGPATPIVINWYRSTYQKTLDRSDSKALFFAVLDLFDKDGFTAQEAVDNAAALNHPLKWVMPVGLGVKDIDMALDLVKSNFETVASFVKAEDRLDTTIKLVFTNALFKIIPQPLKDKLATKKGLCCSYAEVVKLSQDPTFTLEHIFVQIKEVVREVALAGKLPELQKMLCPDDDRRASRDRPQERGRAAERREADEAAAGAGSASAATGGGHNRGRSNGPRGHSQRPQGDHRAGSAAPARGKEHTGDKGAKKCHNCEIVGHIRVNCKKPCTMGKLCPLTPAQCPLEHFDKYGKSVTSKGQAQAAAEAAASGSSAK